MERVAEMERKVWREWFGDRDRETVWRERYGERDLLNYKKGLIMLLIFKCTF